MHESIPNLGLIAGLAALQACAGGQSAVSPEAQTVMKQAFCVLSSYEQSQALFGAKAEAISRLYAMAFADENGSVNPKAVSVTERFIRALPNTVSLPDFSVDPDGSIGLDWIESRTRILSLSVAANSRLAYAWVDGTDKGHAVARFDGREVPGRVIAAIKSISTHGTPFIRVT